MIVDPILGGMAGMSPYEESSSSHAEQPVEPRKPLTAEEQAQQDAAGVLLGLFFFTLMVIVGILKIIEVVTENRREKKRQEDWRKVSKLRHDLMANRLRR